MSVTPPRRPRFLTFILTGTVLGFALGSGLALFGWLEPSVEPTVRGAYTDTSAIGYLGFLGAGLFALLAALLAVVLDQRSDRRL